MIDLKVVAAILLLLAALAFTFLSHEGVLEEDLPLGFGLGDIRFLGPVPEGYDEVHFRQTGETILEDGY